MHEFFTRVDYVLNSLKSTLRINWGSYSLGVLISSEKYKGFLNRKMGFPTNAIKIPAREQPQLTLHENG
jgi:hypothetical protein